MPKITRDAVQLSGIAGLAALAVGFLLTASGSRGGEPDYGGAIVLLFGLAVLGVWLLFSIFMVIISATPRIWFVSMAGTIGFALGLIAGAL